MTVSINGNGPIVFDASSNVGIGTNSPTAYGTGYVTLDVNGTTQGTIQCKANGIIQSLIYGSTAEGGTGTLTNIPFRFVTNNTERMRIDTSGNVGIGTSSPTAKLQVSANNGTGQLTMDVNGGSSAGDYSVIQVSNSGTTKGRLVASNFDTSFRLDTAGSSTGFIQFMTGSSYTERMRIDSSGNVTIGGVGIIGIGQTWTDVTASRALGTTYTNSTGKPIQVMMCFASTSSLSRTQTAVVNGVTIYSQNTNYEATSLNFIVPSGATYSITSTGLTLGTWAELR